MIQNMQKILFFRDFQAFSGGHLKLWHYFQHLQAITNYEPSIYFTPNSIWSEANPWNAAKEKVLTSIQDIKPSLLFLAGLDWEILDQLNPIFKDSVPIINLIQHVRHSHPHDLRYRFLSRKAIRICASPDVQDALQNTGQVNGPYFTITYGLDYNNFPETIPFEKKDISLCIAALKQAPLGIKIKAKLEKIFPSIKLLTQPLHRKEFLNYINRSQITLFLPTLEEGFFIPALEGMKLQTLVICPDCIGNRSFCHDQYNCFRPEFKLESLLNSVHQACSLTPKQKNIILAHATITALQYNLAKEKTAFLTILNQVNHLWNL